MKMDHRGRQYVNWIIAGGDDLMTYEVTFDNTTWHPTEIIEVVTTTTPELGVVVTGRKIRCLVCGTGADPDSVSIVLSAGPNRAKLRVTDYPEIIIQDAGTITVV
jgi:hypothetical protein